MRHCPVLRRGSFLSVLFLFALVLASCTTLSSSRPALWRSDGEVQDFEDLHDAQDAAEFDDIDSPPVLPEGFVSPLILSDPLLPETLQDARGAPLPAVRPPLREDLEPVDDLLPAERDEAIAEALPVLSNEDSREAAVGPDILDFPFVEQRTVNPTLPLPRRPLRSDADALPPISVRPEAAPFGSPEATTREAGANTAAPAPEEVVRTQPEVTTPVEAERSTAPPEVDQSDDSDDIAATAEYLIAAADTEFSVVLDGTGWTFLGVQGEEAGVQYSRVSQEGGNNSFVFFAALSGSFELSFERFDLAEGGVQRHTVFLTVSENDSGIAESEIAMETPAVDDAVRSPTLQRAAVDASRVETLLGEGRIDDLAEAFAGDLTGLDPTVLLNTAEAFLEHENYDEAARILVEGRGLFVGDYTPQFYYLQGRLHERFTRDVDRALFYYNLVVEHYALSGYFPLAQQGRERIQRYYLNIR